MLISALYTLNSQLLLSFSPYLVMPDEAWIFSGGLQLQLFSREFLGVGPNTNFDDELQMDYRQVYIDQSALKKVAPSTFIGPRIRWTRTYDMAFEDLDGNLIPTPAFNGADGHTAAGVGFIARIDKRETAPSRP
ncbi:MAG: hypothetical protein U5K69_13470 [Balneolaceae bacterium]|nr:hypothetical protein [Balneolaceae bacterium]